MYKEYLSLIRRAPIYPYIKNWISEQPNFLYVPVLGATKVAFLDGVALPVNSLMDAEPGPGGILNPRDDQNYGPQLSIPSNLGLSTGTPFIACVLVSMTGGASDQRGHLFKVGTGGGFGVAHCGNDDSLSGTKIALLREAIAWYTTISAFTYEAVVPVFVGYTSEGTLFATQWGNGVEAAVGNSWNAPEQITYINGRNNSVGSPFTVHAVAMWRRPFTNAGSSAFRQYVGDPLVKLGARPLGEMRRMFIPSPFLWPQAAAGGGGVTGTVASTLAGMTSVMSGLSDVSFTGTIASTFAGMTSVMSGTAGADYTGTITSTLDGMAAALAGVSNVSFTGTIAPTLAGVTSVMSGTAGADFTGTITSTLDGMAAALAGVSNVSYTGTIASTLAGVTSVMSGVSGADYTGTINYTFDGMSAVMSGASSPSYTGTIDSTLDGATILMYGTSGTASGYAGIRMMVGYGL